MHLDRNTGSCVLKPKVWTYISPLGTILSSVGCDPLHYCLMLPATRPHVKYWDCNSVRQGNFWEEKWGMPRRLAQWWSSDLACKRLWAGSLALRRKEKKHSGSRSKWKSWFFIV